MDRRRSVPYFSVRPPNDRDVVPAVQLGNPDIYSFVAGGRQILADVVGPYRQLAVSAIDQHGDLDRARPTEVEQRRERGPDGAARVKNIVDQHHRPVVDRERDLARKYRFG